MEIDVNKLLTYFLALVGLALLPLGFIWALNSLFLLNIAYTFANWGAVVFVQVYFQVLVKASTNHST